MFFNDWRNDFVKHLILIKYIDKIQINDINKFIVKMKLFEKTQISAD